MILLSLRMHREHHRHLAKIPVTVLLRLLADRFGLFDLLLTRRESRGGRDDREGRWTLASRDHRPSGSGSTSRCRSSRSTSQRQTSDSLHPDDGPPGLLSGQLGLQLLELGVEPLVAFAKLVVLLSSLGEIGAELLDLSGVVA